MNAKSTNNNDENAKIVPNERNVYCKGWWDAMSACREYGIPTAKPSSQPVDKNTHIYGSEVKEFSGYITEQPVKQESSVDANKTIEDERKESGEVEQFSEDILEFQNDVKDGQNLGRSKHGAVRMAEWFIKKGYRRTTV